MNWEIVKLLFKLILFHMLLLRVLWIIILSFPPLFFYLYFASISLIAFNIGLEVGGEMNIAAGIQIAQLALKHRQNKNQHQRIIVFAGR